MWWQTLIGIPTGILLVYAVLLGPLWVTPVATRTRSPPATPYGRCRTGCGCPREEYLRIIRELIDRGAQAVLLGCTEICLLVKPEDLPSVTLLDSTQLHVDRVVQLALS